MNFLTLSEKKIFTAGVIVKLLVGAFFASYFLTDFFIPFVSYFVENMQNPYEEFYGKNAGESFPYPALMLYLLSAPIFIADIFIDLELMSDQLKYFLLRLPLLIADIGVLVILSSWLKSKSSKKLLWLYWFSPVLIYISFIHGQLDVIPIFFLFWSLDNLFKRRALLSGVIFGLALSAKTMVIISLPFIALYLFSMERSFQIISIYLFSSVATFILVNAPFILDNAFYQMVFHNDQQGRIFDLSIIIGDSKFYFIPACLLLLLVRGTLIGNFNRDIFIMFLGFAFGIILIFISPMQGWYFWLIPFLAYFYAKSDDLSFTLLIFLQIAYLIYFSVIDSSDFGEVFSFRQEDTSFYSYIQNIFGFDQSLVSGVAFTILQVMLGVNCYQIYRQGLNSYSQQKIASKPFLLGIGGNSGVGKTTLADAMLNIFLPMNSLIISGDDMHKWQRGHEKWEEFTHLNPKANLLHKEVSMLNNLKSGKSISRKGYDHNDGTFSRVAMVKPKNIMIFEGLHPFFLSRQRQLYDLKIFIKPDDQLSKHWKIIRDMSYRSYSKEKVLQLLDDRAEDSKNFIESQLQYADIVLSPTPHQPIKEIGNASEDIELVFDLLISNSVYFENIIESFNSMKNLTLTHSYLDGDKQKISISGQISSADISTLANKYIPELFDLGVDYPFWPKNAFGVTIFLMTYSIFDAAEYEKK